MITIAANLLPPVIILVWLWVARAKSRLEAALVAAIGAVSIAFVWIQGPLWPVIGVFWPWLMGLVLAIALWRLARRSAPLAGLPARAGLARVLLPAVVLALVAMQAGWAISGWFVSAPAVELEWPLRGGTFTILHGGSTRPVNAHHGIPAQNYALDVLAINSLGLRASGLSPHALDDYVIFDMPVYAPCAGEVIAARDGVPDGVPVSDPSLLAGNFAAIHCLGVTVLLAHFKNGTLAVRAGDSVERGALLGRVGSSGNSSEPHLHIHADAGRVDDPAALVTTARGVPMRFGGRFLARNDRVR